MPCRDCKGISAQKIKNSLPGSSSTYTYTYVRTVPNGEASWQAGDASQTRLNRRCSVKLTVEWNDLIARLSPTKASRPRCRPGPSLSLHLSPGCSRVIQSQSQSQPRRERRSNEPQRFYAPRVFFTFEVVYGAKKSRRIAREGTEREDWETAFSLFWYALCSRYKIKDLMKWGQRQRQINMHRVECVRKLRTHNRRERDGGREREWDRA